jgi:hypothetical protein
MLRTRLAGRRKDFRERCVRLALWLTRQHGPYGGRVFAVPPEELARDPRFLERVGLTYSQVRGALAALLEIRFLTRLSPPRVERRLKDPPTQFELGTEFATLFPIAITRDKKDSRIPSKAPLFVASYKNPVHRPMRWEPPRPKTEADVGEAKLAALAERYRREPLKLLPVTQATLPGRGGGR